MFNSHEKKRIDSDFILKHWVIKETYSKYFGMGLYMDFKSIKVVNNSQFNYSVSYNSKDTVIIHMVEEDKYFCAYTI